MVKILFSLALFTFFLMTLNFIASLIGFLGTTNCSTSLGMFLSLAYFLIGIPATWFLWYRNLYLGCKNSSWMRFCLFFTFFGLHFLFVILMTVGVKEAGAAGILNGISCLNDVKGVGYFFLILAGLWLINVIWTLTCLRSTWKEYHQMKNKPGSADAAKKDVAKAVVTKAIADGV